MIYFDNAASTPLSPKVRNVLVNTIDNYYANPSSIHFLGEKSKKLLEESRRTFAKFFNVKPNRIIFTSGATESNNLALRGYLSLSSKKEIITSPIEHSSILETCKALEEQEYIVRYVDVDEKGLVILDSLESLINDNTALICIGVVNNEIGTIQDYKAISSIAHNHNIKFFSDAAQCLGHVDVDWSYFDFVTLSAHKIHGPKGVGALVLINAEVEIMTQLAGGGQENGLRSGTENVLGINAFAVALKEIDFSNNEKVKLLKETILSNLNEAHIDYEINGDLETTSPYILSLVIKGYDADTILKSLSINDVYISSASACLQKDKRYSYVITQLYHSDTRAKSTIRISFNKYNTLNECNIFVEILSTLLDTIVKEEQ